MPRPLSEIWKYYEQVQLEERIIVMCKFCDHKFQRANATKMKNHISRCKKVTPDVRKIWMPISAERQQSASSNIENTKEEKNNERETTVRPIPQQFRTLVEFMERYGDLSQLHPPGSQARIRSARLWLKLTGMLNSVSCGVKKSPNNWKKVWADWKTKIKKKALVSRRLNSVGEEILKLTPLELRVSAVMESSASTQNKMEETKDDVSYSGECPVVSHDSSDGVLVKPDPLEIDSLDVEFEEEPQSPPASPIEIASPTGCPQKSDQVRRPVELSTDYLALEHKRLNHEEEKDKRLHEREMERLKIESQRLELQKSQNDMLKCLMPIVKDISELLKQWRNDSNGRQWRSYQ